MNQQISTIASNEVLSPSWAITQQLLSVHHPVIIDGHPEIHRVEHDSMNKQVHIYFPLKDEPYYLILSYSKEGRKYSFHFAYIMAYARVYLAIYSENISPSRITKMLGIKATDSKTKGQPISILIKKPIPHSYWLYEPQANYPDYVENKIEELISRLIPIQAQLAKLSPHARMEVNIYYQGYKDLMGCISISKEQIHKIAAMGLSIDIDLEASGPDLPE